MSNPAALADIPAMLDDAMRILRETGPLDRAAARERDAVVGYLVLARVGLDPVIEAAAELLAEAVPEATESSPRPPQQIHAPIAGQVEPLVPRWPGHDPRLPPGDPHPVHR